MTTIIERNGMRFIQSTVQIPLELKEAAKVRKISLSALLTEALMNKLAEATV